MPERSVNYFKKAAEDAADMAEHFEDQIIEQLLEKNEASDDINNDYPQGDEYHHSSHVDKAYTLLEAATLLDQLDRYEETDSGLWEGQRPRDAISTQAAFTYGQAVWSLWSDLIKKINQAFKHSDLTDKPQDWSPKKKRGPNSMKAFLAEEIKDFRSDY